MRKLLILIAGIFYLGATAQKQEPTSDYYGNGKIHYKGFEVSTTDESGLVYWSPVGTWNYWHMNGNKMMDLMHTARGIRYINMWLPKGEQVLSGGNGWMYEIAKSDAGGNDSLVFEIKDSVKNGKFSGYHIYPAKHILISSGFYDKDKKTGTWTFRDSLAGKNYQTYYFNDKENGAYKAFHANGAIKEEGVKDNDEESGTWKYYDDSGKLTKEINYKNGVMFGKYTEYHPNGQVKETGQYSWTKGYTMVTTVDFGGSEKKTKQMSDKVPKKTGEWKTYDSSGKLLSTKNLSAAAK